MKSTPFLLTLALLLCFATPALATTRHVDLNNPSPVLPYTNWPAAATNIQDAIDASSPGDLILVSDGTYNTGSRAVIDSTPFRVVLNKPVIVRSVNGPGATVIEGYAQPGSFPFSLNSVRCAYLTNGATLIGFKLSKGTVRATSYANLSQPGGGAYCESTSAVLSNCVLIDCGAYIGGGAQGGTFFNCLITNCLGHIGGGGVYAGNLDRCEVIWNTSHYYSGGLYYCNATNCNINYNLGLFGGGVNHGTIYQCTVYGNYASKNALGEGGYGGGTHSVECNNSIIYFNAAASGGNDTAGGTFTNCCSPGLPPTSGNTTNDPLFIDTFDIPGNFHLQTNSPCINAGNNALSFVPNDLDGRSRVIGPRVDIGAYEFQGAVTNDFLTWLWLYYLPTDVSQDFADPDGDGMNNWQEWKADTVPTSPISCLVMSPPYIDASGTTLAWLSVTTRNYTLERSTNLVANPPFQRIATNIAGQSWITTHTDTNAPGLGPCYYRVLVQ